MPRQSDYDVIRPDDAQVARRKEREALVAGYAQAASALKSTGGDKSAALKLMLSNPMGVVLERKVA